MMKLKPATLQINRSAGFSQALPATFTSENPGPAHLWPLLEPASAIMTVEAVRFRTLPGRTKVKVGAQKQKSRRRRAEAKNCAQKQKADEKADGPTRSMDGLLRNGPNPVDAVISQR